MRQLKTFDDTIITIRLEILGLAEKKSRGRAEIFEKVWPKGEAELRRQSLHHASHWTWMAHFPPIPYCSGSNKL